MRLKRGLTTLAVIISLVGGGAASGAAQPLSNTSAAGATRTCSAGYVHASLSWGEKCLRAGEFCKVGNLQYRRYGFTCPASGHLRHTSASQAKKTPASAPSTPSRPAGTTALCNDGTYSYSQHHSGTCSHHGGVAAFYT